MKQHIEFVTDYFVDYAGRNHYFTVVAISDYVEGITIIGEEVTDITKSVKLGFSFCNPEDEFNVQKGVELAVEYALESAPCMTVSRSGIVNTMLVKALLEQEALFVKKNPNNFIDGYKDTATRYVRNQEMKELKNSFSAAEQLVLENLQNNSKFLDNVNKYMQWWTNQQHGTKQD